MAAREYLMFNTVCLVIIHTSLLKSHKTLTQMKSRNTLKQIKDESVKWFYKINERHH